MDNAAFSVNEAILQNVCLSFCVPGEYAGCEELRIGNVNRTYRVSFRESDGSEHIYIVQSLNRHAFRDPERVMHNIELVTRHLREKNTNRRVMNFHHTKDDLPYLITEGGFWRLCDYIPSRTLNNCSSVASMRETGRAFGEFQYLLADLKTDELYETIPDFHNTTKRFEKLFADAVLDTMGRRQEVERELAELGSMREEACLLTELFRCGRLPARVTHNDTKINNLLFDPEEDKAIAVIDLDTVMPGLAAHDFGDAIRFAANTVKEDHPEPEEVRCDLDIARAFTEGYLEQTAQFLTKMELETLAQGPFVITVELACRFLDDFLTGDKYFHTSYPKHNLARVRCQLALARDMKRKQPELEQIIRGCAAKNGRNF